MKAFRLDLTIGIVVCVVGIFLFWNTYTIPPPLQPNAPGAATFPRIIICILIFFGILTSYNGLSQKGKEAGAAEVSIFNKNVLTAVGLIGLYLALLSYLGFILDSFLYLSLTFLTRIRGRVKALLISTVGVACFYLIFGVLLHIRLPRLYLPWFSG